jgi:predicted nucleic acid-binding protein
MTICKALLCDCENYASFRRRLFCECSWRTRSRQCHRVAGFPEDVSATQAHSSLKDFEGDLRAGVFQLRPLTDQVFERARQLSRQTTAKLGTRTADLLHVAMALELSADYLYTFDQQQRKLAHNLHLKLN